jgi:hypothetical protein
MEEKSRQDAAVPSRDQLDGRKGMTSSYCFILNTRITADMSLYARSMLSWDARSAEITNGETVYPPEEIQGPVVTHIFQEPLGNGYHRTYRE